MCILMFVEYVHWNQLNLFQSSKIHPHLHPDVGQRHFLLHYVEISA